MDAVTHPPVPHNEAILSYVPRSTERTLLQEAIGSLLTVEHPLDAYIGGTWRPGRGRPIEVVSPHSHRQTLGVLHDSSSADTSEAIQAAHEAAPAWAALDFDDRAAILLKAADLLSGPWRQRLNAATVLGQSKTAHQAEIDSACELIDFWRFNVYFARRILAEQPLRNTAGVWNRTDHRPLEGFVYAITPFNFTAIAGNLPTAPALMGNTVLWKPSPNQQLAATLTMQLLEEAGLPPGVINMLPGSGLEVSKVALADPGLAAIHFTGSTQTFRQLWSTVGKNLAGYRSYPRLVGETGGKDFVIAHPSADPDVLVTALIRGAFEYSGQKCSAASRAYIARSVWDRMADELVQRTDALSMGDPSEYVHFLGAVIDERAYTKHVRAIERARETDGLQIIAGGTYDDSDGWFVRPTIVLADDLNDTMFAEEYFGPILAVYVYEDDEFEDVVRGVEATSTYALTGSIVAQDRRAISWAAQALRFAAGNFYINDKPTGAVVGQQPFGGGRASGTNDKAGSLSNLMRWTSPRSIKETFVPATGHGYPHQQRARI